MSFPAVAVLKTDARFIDISVNYQDHPVSELIPLIEQELKSAALNNAARRRRPDKVDFQLEVYDLAVRGKSFSEIAKLHNKRPSTVKSSYARACQQIFGPNESIRKKNAPLLGFDHNHFDTCADCKNKDSVDQLCDRAKRFVNQDWKSQRESTGHNTTYRKKTSIEY